MDASALAKSAAALRNSIKALESRSDSLEFWLWIWVTFVVVGVVLEVGFVIWEYIDGRKKYRDQRDIIRSPEKPSGWKFTFEIIGAALVAIGVSGELYIDVASGEIQTDLRKKNGDLIQLFEGAASAALVEASKNAEEAARLHKLAEDEHLARVQLEAKVAWRHLTEAQQKEIGSALGRRFAEKQGLSLWFSSGDTESAAFAGDIAKALIAAKSFLVQPPASILTVRASGKFGDPVRAPDTGVQVQSTRHEQSRQLADAIIHELVLRGFDAVRQKDPPFDPDPAPKVWINVWPRPEGPQGELKLAEEKRSASKK